MPGRLRVQSEGAIDRAMSRGNARQAIVADDRDRQQFLDLPGARVEELCRQLGYSLPECVAGILERFEASRARDLGIERDLIALRHRLRALQDPR
jgi:hypothetical protein